MVTNNTQKNQGFSVKKHNFLSFHLLETNPFAIMENVCGLKERTWRQKAANSLFVPTVHERPSITVSYLHPRKTSAKPAPLLLSVLFIILRFNLL